jgi:hypothetical protein
VSRIHVITAQLIKYSRSAELIQKHSHAAFLPPCP